MRRLRPRAADGDARHDRRPLAHRVALRHGRPLRRAARDAGQEILYSAENAYVTLMAGFTTIQSPGQANDVELRERSRAACSRAAHPDVDPSAQRDSGTPDEIRAESSTAEKADGADVVKLFASASIRDGGKQTMTDEQLQAVCGEAKPRDCARWSTRTARSR